MIHTVYIAIIFLSVCNKIDLVNALFVAMIVQDRHFFYRVSRH